MSSQESGGERLHALDAVRAFALLLGVLHHATLSFLPAVPAGRFAPVHDVSDSLTLAFTGFTGHMFRMSLFFMIAGFFARMMVYRKGVGGFCSDRAKRILLPLAVGCFVLVPLVSSAWQWGMTHGADATPNLPHALKDIYPSYLWFLYYLLVLYAVLLFARAGVHAVDRSGGLRRAADSFVRRAVGSWAGPLLLSLPAIAALLMLDGNEILGGVPPANDSFRPERPSLIVYGAAIALGWMVHRNIGLLSRWRERWGAYLTAAVVCTLACIFIIQLRAAGNAAEMSRIDRAVFALLYGLGSWCWIFGITGFALRFLSGHSPVRRYIADASYWIYLAHYPVVLYLQDAMSEWPAHWTLKFGLIVAAALAFSLLTYHFLVRYSFIGGLLNGRRYRSV